MKKKQKDDAKRAKDLAPKKEEAAKVKGGALDVQPPEVRARPLENLK